MKLFSLDPQTNTLGYVNHSYNPKNIYHRVGQFFIGLGPIVFGTVLMFISAMLLLSYNSDWNLKEVQTAGGLINNIFQFLGNSSQAFLNADFANWKIYLFMYLAITIGSCMTLSPPDIKSMASGFWIIIILIIVLNASILWFNNYTGLIFQKTSVVFSVFYACLFFSFVINLIIFLILNLPFIIPSND